MTNLRAPINSEEAIALDFADRHLDEIRYVAEWGMWFEWDGKRWCVDKTRKIFSLARELCREIANSQNKQTTRKAIASAKTRAAVVSLAGEDRALAATIDQWDADPWLLNTPGGVVDLRTGKMRPALPQDFMTKITAVAPDASCPRPLWNAFLDKVTNGDNDFQKYLGRVCGYSLTGLTIEQAMFFLFGDGSNGKGVTLQTMAKIFNDYHVAAPIETFTESKTDRHPTELAMLRGARLVTSVETEEGRRWAESRIKMLTGGDPVRARFMRQDFFEYDPQFKLLIAGNHKPGLRSVNEAIRRRFNLLPFTVKITDEEKDEELRNKLMAEWPGILAWMVDGCIEWQKEKHGLAPCQKVREATEIYLQGEDAIQLWLDECCIQKAGVWSPISKLFDSWKCWTDRYGEFSGSIRRFSETLEAHSFKYHRTSERGYLGLELKPIRPPDPEQPKPSLQDKPF